MIPFRAGKATGYAPSTLGFRTIAIGTAYLVIAGLIAADKISITIAVGHRDERTIAAAGQTAAEISTVTAPAMAAATTRPGDPSLTTSAPATTAGPATS